MDRKMTHSVRAELADAIRVRYRLATGKQKRKMLDEFVASTGYHEKSAIRVLNGQPVTNRRQTRNRPSLYDEAARGALIVLWEASDRVCGKRLKALLPILLPALERNGHLWLDETIREKILAMSAATIDRLLRSPRSVTRSKKRRRIGLALICVPKVPVGNAVECDHHNYRKSLCFLFTQKHLLFLQKSCTLC
jgi:hypothetical protein